MYLLIDHFIITLIFLDLLILINIVFFILSTIITQNILGYNYALILLGIAASETAVGLGLFILSYKASQNVFII